MQEQETMQKPRVQYSLLDLMAVVLIFASHMALMTQHFLAGMGYALGYTCFALGFSLVLFIVSQRKIEAARAHRPVAFLACVFLIFGLFHFWVAPATAANSPLIGVLKNYDLSESLPEDSAQINTSSFSSSGKYSTEYDCRETFTSQSSVRDVVLIRMVDDISAKLKAKGVSVTYADRSNVSGNLSWEESRSLECLSHGWRGRLKILIRRNLSTNPEPQYSTEIQAYEIRR